MNAVRHGLLSRLEVLPNVEQAEDWTRHIEKTCDALRPVGYLEQLLAERVALNFWRLARVARYEQAAGVENMTRFTDTVAKVSAEVAAAREDHALLVHLGELDGNDAVDAERAARLLTRIAELAHVDIFGDEDVSFPEYPDGVALEDLAWDAEHLRMYLRIIADHAKLDLEVLAAAYAATHVEAEENRLPALKRERFVRDCHNALPDEDELDRLSRYETAIERSLFRTLHELERLQAHRAGAMVPLPMAVDVTCDRAG